MQLADLFWWHEGGSYKTMLDELTDPLGIGNVFSELSQCCSSDLSICLFRTSDGVGNSATGCLGKLGLPRCTATERRLVISFICASFWRAPARLTHRPSASPSHPLDSASLMRVSKLSRISTRRGRSSGSGRRRGERTQLCSWIHGAVRSRRSPPFVARSGRGTPSTLHRSVCDIPQRDEVHDVG